jgi:enamine deaminase RidA (YjgF/YER057c/UK114 family)
MSLRGVVTGLAVAASLAAAWRVPAQQRARRGGVVKERANPRELQQPRGYSHVVTARGGKTIYVAGQLAADVKGALVGRGDVNAQARQAYENLRVALRAVGADFEDVVKLNTYVVGLKPEMLDGLRGVRSSFMGELAVPASTLVGVQALAREGCLVEIEAVAVVE